MPTFRFALQGSALYGKKAGHGKHHGFGWTLFDFVGCSLVGNVELSEEGPLIAGTTSKIAPIAFGERAYYTSSNEDLCSFVASCGCQFGWQGSPDCEYAYPVFRTGHGRRACYAWLPDPRTVSQNVPRHTYWTDAEYWRRQTNPGCNDLWVVHGRLRKEVFN